MEHRKQFQIDDQCELSFELLYLLRWLADYEPESLKKIIGRALQHGFRSHMSKIQESQDPVTIANVHHSIIDFLDVLDTLLHESMNEHAVKKAHQQDLMPSLNKIDINSYDTAAVHHSLDKTITHLEHHPDANPKEFLFKELLKRWKPASKKMVN